MIVLKSPQLVQETAVRWKKEYKVALVPTMGCLHDGHLALVDIAKQFAEKCIVSIFVNPLQFAPHEDFERYPRPIEDDMEKLEAAGVDLLFAPDVRDMYPSDTYSTRVISNGPLTQALCAKSRPGHFDGVATVCTKLFLATQADIAVFGEKDFQQLRVIQQLTEDLNLPVSILPHPIVRESDQVAMSSRNRYLSAEDRALAPMLYQALEATRKKALSQPRTTVGELLQSARQLISNPIFQIDYLEICPERTLTPAEASVPLNEVSNPRLFVAAKLGQTRLIDNLSLKLGQP